MSRSNVHLEVWTKLSTTPHNNVRLVRPKSQTDCAGNSYIISNSIAVQTCTVSGHYNYRLTENQSMFIIELTSVMISFCLFGRYYFWRVSCLLLRFLNCSPWIPFNYTIKQKQTLIILETKGAYVSATHEWYGHMIAYMVLVIYIRYLATLHKQYLVDVRNNYIENQ